MPAPRLVMLWRIREHRPRVGSLSACGHGQGPFSVTGLLPMPCSPHSTSSNAARSQSRSAAGLASGLDSGLASGLDSDLASGLTAAFVSAAAGSASPFWARLRFCSLSDLKSVSYQPLPVEPEHRRRHQSFQCASPAFRALTQRLVGNFLQRLEVMVALRALVFVDWHGRVESLVRTGDYTETGWPAVFSVRGPSCAGQALFRFEGAGESASPRPENTSFPSLAVTSTRSPGPNSPRRMPCASGFSTCCWIARFSGRAPYTGSKPASPSLSQAVVVELERRCRARPAASQVAELDVDDRADLLARPADGTRRCRRCG